MTTFNLHINRRDQIKHPYLVFANPTESVRQIIHQTTQGTSDPHTYACAGKAGATYEYTTGAHGSSARVNFSTGEYAVFLDVLKRRLNYLDPEGNPRPLVVRYGSGNHDQETCEGIATYLEGHYQHEREARTITFFPKDGMDTLYVMELVESNREKMNLVRKEAIVPKFEAEMFSATTIFSDISGFTGVPHIRDTIGGGVRFLAMDEEQYRDVCDELMAYKVAYTMDEWK